MARNRVINRNPLNQKNYFLIDHSFFASRFIQIKLDPNTTQEDRHNRCLEWWREIELQLRNRVARVYIQDISIAETYKLFNSEDPIHQFFKRTDDLSLAKANLEKFLRVSNYPSKSQSRHIQFHIIPTTPQLISSVDRIDGRLGEKHCHLSLTAIVVIATATYLIDVYDLPPQQLNIVSLEPSIRRSRNKIPHVPSVYDPTYRLDRSSLVFID